jgi:hypothetical protein
MDKLHQLEKQVADLIERVAILEKRKRRTNKPVSSMANFEKVKAHIEKTYAFSEPYFLTFISNDDISKEVSLALNIEDNRKTKHCIGLVLGQLGAEKTNKKIKGEPKRGYNLAKKI